MPNTRGAWAAFVVVALTATTARAQVVSDGLGIERFRVAIDRAGLLDVEWADAPRHLQWDAGLVAGFAHDPLVVYDRQMTAVDAIVAQRLTTTLVGSIGLFGRFEIGAAVDVVSYQTGDASAPLMRELPAGGLGDLRLVGKARLAEGGSWQLAVIATGSVPGGTPRGFLREASVTFAPALAVSARMGALRGALNAGYLLRKATDTAGLVSDNEAFARAAAAYGIGATEAFVAGSLARPLGGADGNQIAAELFAGITRPLSPMLSAFAAGGVGLDNGFGTPDWRALLGVRFGLASPATAPVNVTHAPPITPVRAPVDRDGDGTPDASDACPAQAETRNGFRDDDGCPEAPARLSGRVVDPDGRGIAGATLTIAQGDTGATPLTLTSDEDGRFTQDVIGGAVVVSATAPEYQDAAVTVQVEPGTQTTASVTLVRKVRQGQLRGQVLSFDGKPLVATIKVTGKVSQETTSDAEGNFTVELPDGAFQVEITAPGYRTQKRSINVKLDGVTVLNVDLRGSK